MTSLAFPDVAAAIDALLDILPRPDGVEIDDSLTEPVDVVARRLYAFPRRVAPLQGQELDELGMGGADTTVEIRLLLTLAAKGEPRVEKGSRDISLQLANAMGAIVAALRGHDVYPAGSGALWQDLRLVAILPDAARTVKARGWACDIRLSMPWGAVAESSGGAS